MHFHSLEILWSQYFLLKKIGNYPLNLFVENFCRFHSDGIHHKETLWGKSEPIHLEKSSSAYRIPLPTVVNGMVGGRGRLPETGKTGKSKVFLGDNVPWHKRILDPGSDIVLQWNRVFIFACLVALFVDPLYFYLPTVGRDAKVSCVKTDMKLRIVATLFRTIADLFYFLHMIIKFRTAYVAPSSRVFGRGELVKDPKKIARRYLRSDFFIDLIATLPLPQVSLFWHIQLWFSCFYCDQSTLLGC